MIGNVIQKPVEKSAILNLHGWVENVMMVDHFTHGRRTALCSFMEWIKVPSAMEEYHPSSLEAYRHCQQSEKQSCQMRGRVHVSPSKTVNIGQDPKHLPPALSNSADWLQKYNTMCFRLRTSYSHESITRGNRWLLDQHNKRRATVIAGSQLSHQPIPSKNRHDSANKPSCVTKNNLKTKTDTSPVPTIRKTLMVLDITAATEMCCYCHKMLLLICINHVAIT